MRAKPKGGAMHSVLWGEQTATTITGAAGDNALAIVPLGCTEQHAGHLPVDTDTWQVAHLAQAGAQRAAAEHGVQALVLPTLPFGPASEHDGLPGTISLSSELYVGLVKQIVWSLIAGGFRRILVVRGCGGHWVVPGALWDCKAETRRKGHDVTLRMIGVADGWSALQERIFPGTDGGHAAVMETALALAERPNLVRSAETRAPVLQDLGRRYREGGEIFLFDEISDSGALGDPRPATAAGGAIAWGTLIADFARRLAFFDAQDRELGRRSR
jgi:creatinine amidohydrolase